MHRGSRLNLPRVASAQLLACLRPDRYLAGCVRLSRAVAATASATTSATDASATSTTASSAATVAAAAAAARRAHVPDFAAAHAQVTEERR